MATLTRDKEFFAFARFHSEIKDADKRGDASALAEAIDELECMVINTEWPALRLICQDALAKIAERKVM